MRPVMQTKRDVNLALDAAAGHVLSVDDRAEWWIEGDRFLRMLDPDEHDALVKEARERTTTDG